MAIAGWDSGGAVSKVNGNGPDPADTPGCPVISNKLRWEFDEDDVTIQDSYVEIYNESGSGKLFGFVLDFNMNDTTVKLTIDSEVIFELNMIDLSNIQIPAMGGQQIGVWGLMWETAGSRLRFQPECAIAYDSQILVEAKRNGPVDRTLNRKLIALTRET